MSETRQGQEQPRLQVPRGKTRQIVFLAGAVLLVIVAGGIFSAFHYVDQERQRDLQSWQIRLGIVADSRKAAVERWVDDQFATMWDLAKNLSLQLYMTEIALGGEEGAERDDLMPEVSYLRNLLNATASRAGFAVLTEPIVNANVEVLGQAGIALTDADGGIFVATLGMPPVTAGLKQAMLRAAEGRSAFVDLYAGVGDTPTMGFVVPVYAIQEDSGTSNNIGFVVGIRPVGGDLFKLLKQPGETVETAESYLVREVGNVVEYISPLSDGTGPLKRRLSLDTPGLAAAFALQNPSGFAIKRDYGGEEVLVTSRSLTGAPWTLIRKISSSEALSETESRLRTILTVFILIIFGVTVAIVAAWRHGMLLRAAEEAEKFRHLSGQYQYMAKFMRMIADSQPSEVFVVDTKGRYTFANKSAAAEGGIDSEEMIGKTMASVIGPIKASVFSKTNRAVLDESMPVSRIYTFNDSGDDSDGERILRVNHVPIPGDQEIPPTVLMVSDDITEIVSERQQREKIMRQLVRVLVTLVDQRDPYSARHSAWVAEVAVAIAKEMKLSDEIIRTVDLAGNLINLGKILVPPEVLTKEGALTDEEMQFVRNSLLASADLLDEVEFDVPVALTLRQVKEKWDGSGYPDGLKREEIQLTSRIVAVANAFVGMVSPRAYHKPIPFNKVCDILMGEVDATFDRRPVSALLSYIDNSGGRDKWGGFSEAPSVF